MDLFIPVFVIFLLFVLGTLCGACCRSTEQGAIYSTPVVVTSQTHQPVGSNFQVTSHSYHQVTAPIHQMPYNAPVYNPNQSVIVNHANSPYPPPTASFPATHNMSPPPYNEVVNLNSELYPKQQPYNPNFNSTG